MIKIFLESDKFSHKVGVTEHAINSLARKSHENHEIFCVEHPPPWQIDLQFSHPVTYFFEMPYQPDLAALHSVLHLH